MFVYILTQSNESMLACGENFFSDRLETTSMEFLIANFGTKPDTVLEQHTKTKFSILKRWLNLTACVSMFDN